MLDRNKGRDIPNGSNPLGRLAPEPDGCDCAFGKFLNGETENAIFSGADLPSHPIGKFRSICVRQFWLIAFDGTGGDASTSCALAEGSQDRFGQQRFLRKQVVLKRVGTAKRTAADRGNNCGFSARAPSFATDWPKSRVMRGRLIGGSARNDPRPAAFAD
ncbi:MAG TPA: hypothetical protein VN808_03590 [Stellaceae bacterium]|nr:hypothetical protein [Stellaceae bacterium]